MTQLTNLFYNHFGHKPEIEALNTGSGSSRNYFRLTDGEHTAIGTVGTSREENDAFLYATHHFHNRQLPVPQIYEVSDDHMTYLQEDLGNTSLYQAIKQGRENGGDYSSQEQELLSEAIRLLPQFQINGATGFDTANCYPTPRMDAESVMFDLNYFKYCFLKLLPDLDFNEHHLQEDFGQLSNDIDALSNTGKSLILRDFQARNIMIKQSFGNRSEIENNKDPYKLYFIDYQGCRIGPPEYDVASFLWQASAHYPQILREKLIEDYIEARTALLPTSKDEIRNRLNLMVLFRTMQVLGAYGFRGLIQKKEYFVRSIPPAIDNLKEILAAGAADNYHYLKEILYGVIKSNATPMSSKPTAAAIPNTSRGELTVTVYSFSYKKGIPKDESGNGGGYVFDCRSTHNPGRYEQYKKMTGLDQPVIKFLEDDGEITKFLDHVYALIEHHTERYISRGFTNLMVSFGCTGGQHRSVYSAQHLAEHLHARFPHIRIHLIHREQDIDTWLAPE